MATFNESQLEQAFVELIREQGYDYVHGDSVSRDTRDVLLYDNLRGLVSPQYHLLYSQNS